MANGSRGYELQGASMQQGGDTRGWSLASPGAFAGQEIGTYSYYKAKEAEDFYSQRTRLQENLERKLDFGMQATLTAGSWAGGGMAFAMAPGIKKTWGAVFHGGTRGLAKFGMSGGAAGAAMLGPGVLAAGAAAFIPWEIGAYAFNKTLEGYRGYQDITSDINSVAAGFMNPSVSSGTSGFGFSASELADTFNTVRDGADRLDLGKKDISGLAKAIGGAGGYQTVRSAREFRKRLSEDMKALKQLKEEFSATQQEAEAFFAEATSYGYTPGQAVGLRRRAGQIGGALGVPTYAVMGAAQQFGARFQGTGINPLMGANMFMNSFSRAEAAIQSGSLDQGTVASLGGVAGVAQVMANANSSVLQSKEFQRMVLVGNKIGFGKMANMSAADIRSATPTMTYAEKLQAMVDMPGMINELGDEGVTALQRQAWGNVFEKAGIADSSFEVKAMHVAAQRHTTLQEAKAYLSGLDNAFSRPGEALAAKRNAIKAAAEYRSAGAVLNRNVWQPIKGFFGGMGGDFVRAGEDMAAGVAVGAQKYREWWTGQRTVSVTAPGISDEMLRRQERLGELAMGNMDMASKLFASGPAVLSDTKSGRDQFLGGLSALSKWSGGVGGYIAGKTMEGMIGRTEVEALGELQNLGFKIDVNRSGATKAGDVIVPFKNAGNVVMSMGNIDKFQSSFRAYNEQSSMDKAQAYLNDMMQKDEYKDKSFRPSINYATTLFKGGSDIGDVAEAVSQELFGKSVAQLDIQRTKIVSAVTYKGGQVAGGSAYKKIKQFSESDLYIDYRRGLTESLDAWERSGESGRVLKELAGTEYMPYKAVLDKPVIDTRQIDPATGQPQSRIAAGFKGTEYSGLAFQGQIYEQGKSGGLMAPFFNAKGLDIKKVSEHMDAFNYLLTLGRIANSDMSTEEKRNALNAMETDRDLAMKDIKTLGDEEQVRQIEATANKLFTTAYMNKPMTAQEKAGLSRTLNAAAPGEVYGAAFGNKERFLQATENWDSMNEREGGREAGEALYGKLMSPERKIREEGVTELISDYRGIMSTNGIGQETLTLLTGTQEQVADYYGGKNKETGERIRKMSPAQFNSYVQYAGSKMLNDRIGGPETLVEETSSGATVAPDAQQTMPVKVMEMMSNSSKQLASVTQSVTTNASVLSENTRVLATMVRDMLASTKAGTARDMSESKT